MWGGNKRTRANKQTITTERRPIIPDARAFYRNNRPDSWVPPNGKLCIPITVPHLISGLLIPRGSLLAKLLGEEPKTGEVQKRDGLSKKKAAFSQNESRAGALDEEIKLTAHQM